MTEHTPGPWIVEEDEYSICYRIVAGEEDIGEAYMLDGKPGDAGEANARRMAAAPEMWEVLAMIVKDDNAMDALWQHFDSMEMDKISAAIAKARGSKD